MRTKRLLGTAILAAALALGAIAAPHAALGSGGSGGGGSTTINTSPVTMTCLPGTFNGTVPVGRTTYSYSSNGTYKSMTISVDNVNVADGDTVDVEVDEAVRVSNWISHTYTWLPMTIYQGHGSLTWSTANGDIPPFYLPTAGTTTVNIWGDYTVWPGTYELATGSEVLYGTFGALTRG
jgi:hypothetical protein